MCGIIKFNVHWKPHTVPFLFLQPLRQKSRRVFAGAHEKSQKSAEAEPAEEDVKFYCLCRRPDEGGMVMCDNPDCHLQWFHMSCVGVKDDAELAEKNWYCPDCRPLFPESFRSTGNDVRRLQRK